MKKAYQFISRMLVVILIGLQLAGNVGMEQVHAAGPAKALSSIIVNGGNFDTGILINQDYSIEMTFAVTDVTQYRNYYVAMTSDNQKVFRLRNEVGKGLYAAYGWYNGNIYTMKANEELTIAQRKNVTFLNQVQVQKSKVQKLQAATTLKFGDFKGYIKYFRIWNENNQLVADYQPALDGSGRACMYESVKGTYLYYSGQCQAGEEQNTETTPGADNNTGAGSNAGTDNNTEDTTTDKPDSDIAYVDALQVKGGTFDSGLTVDLNSTIEAVFSLTTLEQYGNVYVAMAGTSRVHRLRYEYTKGLYDAYGWYNGKIADMEQDKEISLLQKKNLTYIDGSQVRKATAQTLASTTTLKFGDFKGILKSLKVWDKNGKLTGEFLAAKDTAGKACMYDTVSGRYVYYTGSCQEITTDDSAKDEIIQGGADNSSSDSTTLPDTDNSIEVPEPDNSDNSVVNNNSLSGKPADLSGLSENEKKVYYLMADLFENYSAAELDILSYQVTYDNFYAKISPILKDQYYWEQYVAYNMYPIGTISGKYMKTCRVENIDSGFAARKERVEESVREYLAGIDGKMTDVDKVLWAHEFVVSRTQYTKNTANCGSASGSLGDGLAKCTGYAEAMQLLLHYAGIENDQVGSGKMYHAWLAVKLDGEWYHIDPTWDDTKQGSDASKAHIYLLRNSTEFRNSYAHHSWSYEHQGQDGYSTRFSNWYVHDVAGAMYYHNGLWYYKNLADNTIYCADIEGNNRKAVVAGNGTNLQLSGIKNGILSYYKDSVKYTMVLQ